VGGLFKLEGKVINQYTTDENWVQQARVLVDGGAYIGIIKADGSFAVNGLPSGSYVVEVVHPLFAFDSVRVEITSKAKVRARILDNIQPFQIKNVVSNPLRLRCKGRYQYFQQREQWRISDFLFNPMVLMMFLPLLMMFLLPKLMNSQDPEIQKEMQQSMNWMNPKSNLPELSELMT
ncbi:hypothetical protein HELRODRAFT_134860, partial [Helobdella robusta]|uniref:ER membrane protein complex subunit 7 beta-sandwich domain-containing protein n=1 Tax=Helobdella robusta TaxID=6412 RepID=T1EI61_HELRO